MSIPVKITAGSVLEIGPRKGLALFFPATTTYTIPASGWYRLSALGAGGSGGAIFTTTTGGSASGGGGGYFVNHQSAGPGDNCSDTAAGGTVDHNLGKNCTVDKPGAGEDGLE